MSLLDDIKAISEGKLNGQSDLEKAFEKKLNRLFYLDKKIKEETEFIQMVMTRGQDTAERKGLHCSNVISAYSPFCLRGQVLSIFYRQNQNRDIPVSLKRIYTEGDAIHEKWQRLFIRGGYARPDQCDKTKYCDVYDLSYTPDIICTIDGVEYVGEIKSVNTNQFRNMVKNGLDHESGKIQCFLYMYFTNIRNGFVLCEDKNTQDFYVRLYQYDGDIIKSYIRRLDDIQKAKKILLTKKKIPGKIEACTEYGCRCALDCPMSEVCWGKEKEKL